MYGNNFLRIEEKYLLTKSEKTKLLKKINNYIEEDTYFKSEIHNIYYDTNNNDLIINSLEKPVFKDKIRIRSYGLPSIEDDIFLELKVKYNDIVGKRRIKLKLKDFNNYINNNFNINNQIFKEIDYYFHYYKLKPAMYIAYDRDSYRGLTNKDLRITFDSNLRSRTNDLYFDKDKSLVSYFNNDKYIMEIKTVGSMPLWLVKSLSEIGIVPTSFSKYGKIYAKGEV